ncbi:MAG: hypothetical protein MJZ02_05600 [Paludibacteraceae bacterium]|nr:hypothetical protein [Paludibacteraceae bacterium]
MTNKYVFSKIAFAVLCMVMVQVLDFFFYIIGSNNVLVNFVHTAGTLVLCGMALINVVKAFGGHRPKTGPAVIHKMDELQEDRMVA